MTAPRIVLVDPRARVRSNVASSLVQEHGLDVAATADDLESTVLQAARIGADVVVVATSFVQPLTALCQRISAIEPRPRILVFDSQPDEEALLASIEAGADGYSTGVYGMPGLAAAIRAIARGESVVPAAMLGPLLRRLIQRQRESAQAAERLVGLTPREREVLSLLVEGLDQQGIADALFISPQTARTHLQRVLRKLDVHSRVEAVELVERTGLTDRLESIIERSAS